MHGWLVARLHLDQALDQAVRSLLFPSLLLLPLLLPRKTSPRPKIRCDDDVLCDDLMSRCMYVSMKQRKQDRSVESGSGMEMR